MADQEFGVSFKKSVTELQRLTAELSVLGKDLDGVEVRAGSMSKAYTHHFNRMKAAQGEVSRSLRIMGVDAETSASIADASFKQSTKTLVSMAQSATNAAAKADALRHSHSGLARQLGQMAKDQEYTKWQQKIAAMQAKTANESRYLRKRLDELNSAQGRVNTRLKAAVSAKERIIKADVQQTAKLHELQAEYQRLNGAQAMELETLKVQIRERRKHVQTLAREQLGLSAAAGAQEKKAAAEDKSSRVLKTLSQAEARYEARLERANRLIETRNKLTQEQARASAVLTAAQARQARAMEQNVALYERQAKYAAMTNAQLLGLSGSVRRAGRDMNMSAQAAAMFRAGLGGLNASIGIFTSATVLAAAATYAIASAFRTGISAGMEFTETMARAEAVMMTSTSAVTAAGTSMAAVEARVRSLGASTLFTSTEVAGGLVDLGMAGLSASEAMTALAPSLDLAAIGGIEMSKSADIATNVMTSFNKEAGELSEVVDIMATAVTNSNTTVEQLANALSYVGPAANAAGFSLRDTTAAIELLSNAGIKASRAGTGLRRFMLNIQNPTAKGAAVLQQYGISVVDAEGHTRSMMDILGQFNKALHKDAITPAERTAAIMDLVGVRAQSAVARMIGSFDEFGVLRRQLDQVQGSAQQMRETMEDVLSMDWRQLKSAFQDIQLDAFEKYEPSLRSFTAQARLLLMELQSVNEEMSNSIFGKDRENTEFVTELDILIARAGHLGEVALWVGASFAAWKIPKAVSTVSGAAAENLQTLQLRLGTVNERLKRYRIAQLAATNITKASTGSMTAQQLVMTAYAKTLRGATVAAQGFAVVLTTVARAAQFASAALGWVGVLIGVYQTIKTIFSSDIETRIKSHNAKIAESKTRYDELKEAIQETTEARQKMSLELRATEMDEEAEGLRTRIELSKVAAEQFGKETDAYARLQDAIAGYETRLTEVTGQASEAREAAGKVGFNVVEIAAMREHQGLLSESMGITTNQIKDTQAEIENLRKGMDLGSGSLARNANEQAALAVKVEMLNKTLELQKKAFLESIGVTDEAAAAAANHAEMLGLAVHQQKEMLKSEAEFEDLTSLEKANQLRAESNVIVASSIRLSEEGIELSETGRDIIVDQINGLATLTEREFEYRREVEASLRTVNEKYEKVRQLQLNEVETLKTLEAKLLDVAVARAKMYAISVVSGEEIDPTEMEALLDRQIEYLGKINSIKDSAATASRKTFDSAAKDLKKQLTTARSLFDSLREDYDPTGAAFSKYQDQLAMLDSLRHATGENSISQDEYSDAVAALSARFRETLTDADPFLARLKDIRSEYLGFIQDTSDSYADRDWIQANMKGAEKDLAMGEWERKNKEALLSEMPEVDNISQTTSGPFSDYNELLEQDSKQQEWFDAEIERHKSWLETKELNERQYTERVSALTAARAKQIESTEHQSHIARMSGYAELFGNLAGMSATFAGDSSAITQSLLVFQQGAALATTIMEMTKGEAKSFGELGPIAGAAAAAGIAAQAATLVSTISSIASPSQPSFTTSSYSGQYDTGGHIPKGSYGIVGEVGPEIVHGPAQVTGRKSTDRQMQAGRGGDSITISPQITVNVEGGGGGSDSEAEEKRKGKIIGNQVEAQVLRVLQKEMAPRGVLDKWRRN